MRRTIDPTVKAAALDAIRAGSTRTAAATAEGVHVNTVNRWCRDAGITVSRTPQMKIDAAVASVRDGMPLGDAARRHRVTAEMLSSWCRAAGLTPARRGRYGVAAQVKAEAVAPVKAGETLKAVGDDIGVSHVAVLNWCNAAGVVPAHSRRREPAQAPGQGPAAGPVPLNTTQRQELGQAIRHGVPAATIAKRTRRPVEEVLSWAA